MNALFVVVATAALGIEVGWEPLPGGGHEYTIQIEPQLLDVLEKGEDEIYSDVPAGIDVRRYRIVVGVGKLRREAGPLVPEAAPAAGAHSPADNEPTARSPMAQPPVDRGTVVNQQVPPSAAPAVEVPPAAANPAESHVAAGHDPFGTPPSDDRGLGEIPPATGQHHDGQPTVAGNDPYESSGVSGEPAEKPAVDPDFPQHQMPELPSASESPATEPPPAGHPATDKPPAVDPWAKRQDAPSPSDAQTPPLANVDRKDAPTAEQPPGKLPADSAVAGHIKQTTFGDAKVSSSEAEPRDAAKPALDGEPPGKGPTEAWLPLFIAIVLLACSLGGNVYLGWVAVDARARYRNVVAKFRGAAA